VKIVFFCPSLLSDWNNGNAHFLRGVCSELISRGHELAVYEPADSWSYENLVTEYGEKFLEEFQLAYPRLSSIRYQTVDLERMLTDADLVIVHEWNARELIVSLGEYRRRTSRFRLLFHDTHHRVVTQPQVTVRKELLGYDGVLAYGATLRDVYVRQQRARRAWIWHEAADIHIFKPKPTTQKLYDLVWIGNWGDDERSAELYEFFLNPVCELGLKAIVYGVRYPLSARRTLEKSGIVYGGWLPNFKVPIAFAQSSVTVHIPRRPYVTTLQGIPTIRPFEALACGIPLISAPWQDKEGLFRAGKDLLFAENGEEMAKKLNDVLSNQDLAMSLARNGMQTIHENHTCAHRVDQLFEIIAELNDEDLTCRGA
jgi:spore maturation protein CgeB